MKIFSVAFLLLAFVFSAVAVPDSAYAKKIGDDKYDYQDSRDDEYEDNEDNDDRDDSSDDRLEVEADVFTDMTIIEVELKNGRKTVFRTDVETRAEVVNVVVAKFNLTKAEVETALDFEIEDRASRANERAKLSFTNNSSKPIKVRDDSSNLVLEVEAVVFTNTTIVKVEKGGVKTIFETTATTSDAVAEAVIARVSGITLSQVKTVLDFEIEDRASRISDFAVPSNNSTVISDAELVARIAELQKLIEALTRLVNDRLGN